MLADCGRALTFLLIFLEVHGSNLQGRVDLCTSSTCIHCTATATAVQSSHYQLTESQFKIAYNAICKDERVVRQPECHEHSVHAYT
jgi:hypothetical protein